MVRTLRIFISSPGDVKAERQIALAAIEALAHEPLLHNKAACEAVAWDKPGEDVVMQATMTPQEAVDKQLPFPSACDIVVVILWARFGTPLPPPNVKPNGQPYLSGTEYEYLDACEGAAKRGLPKVVVYRRTEDPKISLDDHLFDDKKTQWQRVKEFFRTFDDPVTGSLLHGYNSYETVDEFGDKFPVHLRKLVGELLDEQPPGEKIAPPVVPPTPKDGFDYNLVRQLNQSDRELDLWYQHFRDDVVYWEAHQRHASYLYGRRGLRDAARYSKRYPEIQFSPEQQAFLAQSRSQTRLWFGFVALLIAGYLLMSLFALTDRVRAALLYWESSSSQVVFPAGTARLGDHGQYRVVLDAFAIDKTEVSVGQYIHCVQTQNCTLPDAYATLDQLQQVNARLPVTGVTAYQAAAFCRWLGRRLPTAAEWERAARGTDARLWPWGDEDPESAWVNVSVVDAAGNPSVPRPTGLVPVDDPAYRRGGTPEGILFMIGNAWEWTSTPVDEASPCENEYCVSAWDGIRRVTALMIRGFGWQDVIYASGVLTEDEAQQITAAMQSVPGFDLSSDIGFRCAGP